MSIAINDNSKAVTDELNAAILRALETVGMTAESYAKKLAPVDTGNLRNSIAHRVDEREKAVYIGTDVEYAAFVELGTGIYTDGGRQDSWVYQDDRGRWHHTNGQRAQPFLKPAAVDHKDQYRSIIENELKKG